MNQLPSICIDLICAELRDRDIFRLCEVYPRQFEYNKIKRQKYRLFQEMRRKWQWYVRYQMLSRCSRMSMANHRYTQRNWRNMKKPERYLEDYWLPDRYFYSSGLNNPIGYTELSKITLHSENYCNPKNYRFIHCSIHNES
jgi:hypothetical protein